ncbi:MAG: AlpA family phage regulatory protein [Magnetococcus sp. THC-1_WYH]
MDNERTKTKPTLISIKKVMAMTSMSKANIYKQIAAGRFPKQYSRKNIRRVYWFEHEIIDWIQSIKDVPGWRS